MLVLTTVSGSYPAPLRRCGGVYWVTFSLLIVGCLSFYPANITRNHKTGRQKLESLDYFPVAENMGLTSASITWLALNPNTFGEKRHKTAITAFQGHSRSDH